MYNSRQTLPPNWLSMTVMKPITLILALFCCVVAADAQVNRANRWFFGAQAGIDFSSGQPVADTSAMTSIEGSSTISDSRGKLLFYSDGETLWDRNHRPTPNSTGLIGDMSAAQSSLLVPKPGDSTAYYLFTTLRGSNGSQGGLYYSVIDTRLRAGLGDIGAVKNVLVQGNGSEELAGTLHCDGESYWIVTRMLHSDSLYFSAYRLGRNGLGPAVVSAFECPEAPGATVGCIAFSRDAGKMCFTSFGTMTYVFSFDRQKGFLRMLSSIPRVDAQAQNYAVAFSPNATKLYLSTWVASGDCQLLQYDLNASGPVASTATVLDTVSWRLGSPNGYGFIGQMRLAPDGRIYSSRWKQERIGAPYYSHDSLDAILAPDQPGLACRYQRNHFWLRGRPTMIGMPNFISTFVAAPPASECPVELRVAALHADFSLSPNPASGLVRVSFTRALSQAQLRLTSSTGQLLRSYEVIDGGDFGFSVSGLPAGLYFVTLSAENLQPLTQKLQIVQ